MSLPLFRGAMVFSLDFFFARFSANYFTALLLLVFFLRDLWYASALEEKF